MRSLETGRQREYNVWALTVSGYSFATEARERAGDFLKWDKLQGGDWYIPLSYKTEYLRTVKRQLVFLICRFNMQVFRASH